MPNNQNGNTQQKSRKKKTNIFNKQEVTKLQKEVELKPKQHDLSNKIKSNTFTIVSGPAGTSKTWTTCYAALELLGNNKIEEIIITKPLIESSYSMGFLPGSLDEKIQPYMKSYISTFTKMIGVDKLQELLQGGVIKIETLNFMRGETYDNAILLLDEAQNLDMPDLMLWITRIGKNSKAVLMGDISQYDIKESKSNFKAFRDMLEGMNGLEIFTFEKEDIVRNPFLIEITDRYEKWKFQDSKEKND